MPNSEEQKKQNAYISEFSSSFVMDEFNSKTLLSRIKDHTGSIPTPHSKAVIKQKYTEWFRGYYAMDEHNTQILSDRCKEIFGDTNNQTSHNMPTTTDIDSKVKNAFDYAVNFYNTHDRSLYNQQFCIDEMVRITGFDMATCYKIVTPILQFHFMNETINIGNEAIYQQLNTVTNNIRNHLLTVQPTLQPDTVQALPNMPQVPTAESINTTQANYIAQFASEYEMNEINSDILLTRLETSTNARPTRESKNIVKSHYGNWFQGNYCMDTHNVKILDVRCIKMFEAPKDHNLTVLTLTNHVIDDSFSPYISDMLRNNNCPNLKVFNLSNNPFTDHGIKPIAEALKSGGTPSLKVLDVHGNSITKTGEGYLVKALQHPMTQSVMVAVKRTLDLKTMISGSKEEKQAMIKETLQTAQNNGVDVKNIAVSKGFGEYIWNKVKIGVNFTVGFTKCNIIPEDSTSLAADVITAKISKKAFVVTSGIDAVVCLFDTAAEVSTSAEGVQFIRDLELCGANSVIDSIE